MTGPPPRPAKPQDLRGHFVVRGALAPGMAVTNAVPVSELVACAGATRIRGRWLSTGAGTLSFQWLRPDGVTAYAANNPANVAILAGTENKFDIDPHFGEGLLKITFTPSANGTITYCDISQI